MDITPLPISGAYVVTPRQFPDERGVFLESFRRDHLQEVTGRRMSVAQTNVSVSSRGTVRGVHYADVPPSQAKYVTALAGSFLDFVVDIRVGSPTFGQWASVLLDTSDRRAVFISEGLGHAVCALEDDSALMYLCSTVYTPRREHGIDPRDPRLNLALPQGFELTVSAKDASSPTLAEAEQTGRLPTWEQCQRLLKLGPGRTP